MSKLNLEYVISACGMMGVFTNHVYDNHRDLLKQSLLDLIKGVNDSVHSKVKNTNPTIAALFNGYTEAAFTDRFKALDNLGAAKLYADSGGLQIVTAGKPITPQIKQDIYKTQTAADYAMCFDEIALGSFSVTRTRNERSNVGNKIFKSSLHAEKGSETGRNIKEQIEAFKKLGAKTRVIPIIQGNNSDDMMVFYDRIVAELEDDDYNFISGMAIADTCMGNGELESIEMLRGAKRITDVCHDNIKKHLHILGVGSISRMRPILYLTKSGYLNTFEKISYDSSSHTSTFDYGLLKVNGTCRALGGVRTPKAEAHFKNVYKLFYSYLKDKATEGEFLDIILGDGKRDWKYSTVKDAGLKLSDEKMMIAFLAKVMHTYYQIDNFVTCIDAVLDEEVAKNQHIGALLRITDEVVMKSWMNSAKSSVKSKRILREENHATLEELFK
jgi:hypothetical protein